MNFALFLLPMLALLLAPGPTNALIALSGAQSNGARITPVIAAALFGYIAAVLPLALLGTQLVGRWPQAPVLLRLVAAAWLLVVAAGLWRAPTAANPACRAVTPRAIFLTTLTNPKALVVALVLLPPVADPRFPARIALFAVAVIAASIGWARFGALLGAGVGGPRRTGLLGRAASVWLALVSASLTAAAITA